VALNLCDDPTEIAVPATSSRIAVGTDRSRNRGTVTGAITLGPWEGVVLVETA
jgi:hypothetical protein